MPEFDLLTVLGGAGVLVSGVWGGFVYVNGRFDKKADKEHVDQEFGEVRTELKWQRENIAKLIDQIRNSDQRAQDRHEHLLERLRQ
jgi:glutamate synthase domain-containing protein 3